MDLNRMAGWEGRGWLETVVLLTALVACRPDPSAVGETGAPDGGMWEGGAGDGGVSDGGASDGGASDGGAPDDCERSGALIYGPTDLAGAELLAEAGFEVTVWNARQWSEATTEDFARYDIVVVGEQSCAGPDQAGELAALDDSQATWGPAIDGRVMVSGLDLQCHITDWEDAAPGDETVPPLLHANALTWLSEGCGTSVMVATDWGRRDAGHLAVLGPFEEVAQRGDLVTITEPDHPLFDGIGLDDLNNWGSTFHTMITSWPDDYRAVATGYDDAGVVLLRESTLE